MIYLRVDDIITVWKQLKARGVTFDNAAHMVHRHEDGTEEWMAFFKDPEDRPLVMMVQVKT